MFKFKRERPIVYVVPPRFLLRVMHTIRLFYLQFIITRRAFDVYDDGVGSHNGPVVFRAGKESDAGNAADPQTRTKGDDWIRT